MPVGGSVDEGVAIIFCGVPCVTLLYTEPPRCRYGARGRRGVARACNFAVDLAYKTTRKRHDRAC